MEFWYICFDKLEVILNTYKVQYYVSSVSIGRRLQDPLLELVKIEAKHIGVGMYQVSFKNRPLDQSI